MGDVVGYFVQCVSHSQASGDFGYREASGFGSQSRRATHPRVHLDYYLSPVLGIHCELHIGAAGFHPYSAHACKRSVSHGLVFHVGKRLRWCDGDAVACVNSHRVEVLNGANHHAVVGSVAHHLQFELFPADYGLFYEHFPDRAGRETFSQSEFKFCWRVGNGRSFASEDVGRADDHRQPEMFYNGAPFFHVAGNPRSRHGKPDAHHGFFELLPVFSRGDGFHAGPDEFCAAPLQRTRIRQSFGHVQSRLAADGGQQRIGAFLCDDGFYDLGHQRFHIGGVGKARVGHYRGRVGVGEDHPIPLFLEHPTGLNP